MSDVTSSSRPVHIVTPRVHAFRLDSGAWIEFDLEASADGWVGVHDDRPDDASQSVWLSRSEALWLADQIHMLGGPR